MFFPYHEMLMPDNDCEFVFYHHQLKEMNDIKRSFNGYILNNENNSININITSPYPLEDDKKSHGVYKFNINKNELELIENNHSPRFVTIDIDKIEDLIGIDTKSKHFINFNVNHKILSKTETKNKLDMFLSKCNYNNIHYYNIKKIEENITIESTSKIRDILSTNIENKLKQTLNEIFSIYDKNIN
jgi:hypothetical protein